MRHTPAAVMEAGACSWAAMGSASATVTPLGTSARASSAYATLCSGDRAEGVHECNTIRMCCFNYSADARNSLMSSKELADDIMKHIGPCTARQYPSLP